MMMSDMLNKIRIVTPHKDCGGCPPPASVIALGTFDGVHIAHQRLLHEAVKLKESMGAAAVGAWCFEDSPAAILRREEASRLTSTEEKLSLLFKSGVDFAAVADFEDFRDTEAWDFANNILKSSLSAVGAVCGYDHKFGKGGKGNSALLEDTFGKENTVTVARIVLDGETVSSSAVREHLRHGEIELANKMLGRCFSFTAPVTEGKRLGRRLGFPTANQGIPHGLIHPKHGVYATRCLIDGKAYIGITNVGVRPSIDHGDDHAVNCETYIIGLSSDLYGKQMTVELCSYLRDEKKFSSLDELSKAIEGDRAACEKYFSEHQR